MVETLRGASIGAATASEKPCSLKVEALGARYGDLGSIDSSVESVLVAESVDWTDWAGTGGSGLTWLLDPRNRACWVTLQQSE